MTGPRKLFIACYDYGTGGIWYVFVADTADQIHARYSDLTVWPAASPPAWMTPEKFDEIARRRTFDIDDVPSDPVLDNHRKPS